MILEWKTARRVCRIFQNLSGDYKEDYWEVILDNITNGERRKLFLKDWKVILFWIKPRPVGNHYKDLCSAEWKATDCSINNPYIHFLTEGFISTKV